MPLPLVDSRHPALTLSPADTGTESAVPFEFLAAVGTASRLLRAETAWQRWSDRLAVWNTPAVEAFLRQVDLSGAASILDLASGSGEPGLRLAARVAAAGGWVTATDVSVAALDVARVRAAMLGLENLTWVVSAAEALDFPTARFDAVTCLFGIPHLRDPWTACRKAHRFLKASGAMVLGVWAEGAHDPLARDTVGVGFEHGVFPSPTSETSGSGDASAWWRRGSLENLLRTSGFADVRETRLPLDLVWEGPGEELWRFLQETMNHLDWEKAREHAAWPKVEREVISRLDRRKTERGLVIPSSIRVAVARPGIRISNGL